MSIDCVIIVSIVNIVRHQLKKVFLLLLLFCASYIKEIRGYMTLIYNNNEAAEFQLKGELL